ncbi:hypothetical protein GCL60_11635 [Silvanigrella paludirubra]|uniref:Flagellar protein FlgN n=1 Tax=Silvanigrella paludirubra TaxID=2499159 RepID=A0A6N6VQF4_9BACT|nr:flagellar export chaperone FlgN [Silvanigrella paludirubra]KAB8037819.1 hypothetical protein GCL60_11635 [Silvanigrella paludirubra]
MEELLNLIIQFNDILRKQIQSYLEFLPILDEEEIAISNYDLASLEKMVIIKDQHSRIAQSLEERRVIVLKKICYMMAFDPRGQNLSLKLFKFTFSTYIKNIKTLVGEVTYNKLLEQETTFNEISSEFEKTFEVVYPRIYRNQAILKKLMKNVSLSISLFQSEAEVGMNYDSLGKAQSLTNKNNGLSSMRVKA